MSALPDGSTGRRPRPSPEGRGPGAAEPGPEDRKPKAGRNLPVAIGVGLGMAAVVLASLLFEPVAFLGVAVVGVAVACWETGTAMRKGGKNVPVFPLAAAGVLIVVLAWFGGATGLLLGTAVGVAALFVWRLSEGATDYRTDVSAAALVLLQVPFLAGFIMLLATSENGSARLIDGAAAQVLIALFAVVCSDTGGYAAGVLIGRHPMTPRISPKKSWEGLGGSVAAAALGGSVTLWFFFGVPFPLGVAFGVCVALAATLGDLSVSLLKRDLGIKDMSNIIPGHGGVMDRLDSILMVAPVAYVWFRYLLG
ncbi:phosphatidate cytidylyltransferase [Glycomyces sp. TRM65418]|uniref:phosphatidate cytidylyltransferase n=1 Tax=Glycomyces sp. TRM65418 TaxID=2867006 RepID=UPI001CE5F05B|nr:phosphatidate cytidylyltransferase [Glycomyces sp. TRM65418]MCC3762204.1 phosphatidate cytidylyltransferase [Glycomyces sp. TRM65418]QZD56262.1 phosphatidate cytidylyltransferase [Glycomyces sp. TRM65418]